MFSFTRIDPMKPEVLESYGSSLSGGKKKKSSSEASDFWGRLRTDFCTDHDTVCYRTGVFPPPGFPGGRRGRRKVFPSEINYHPIFHQCNYYQNCHHLRQGLTIKVFHITFTIFYKFVIFIYIRYFSECC